MPIHFKSSVAEKPCSADYKYNHMCVVKDCWRDFVPDPASAREVSIAVLSISSFLLQNVVLLAGGLHQKISLRGWKISGYYRGF